MFPQALVEEKRSGSGKFAEFYDKLVQIWGGPACTISLVDYSYNESKKTSNQTSSRCHSKQIQP